MKTPTAETRAGSPLLLVALIVVSLVVTSLFMREGDGGPLHRARAGVLWASTPFVVAGDVVTSPLSGVGAWFSGLRVSQAELATLRSQNDEMRARLTALEEAKLENDRLQGLLKFSQHYAAKSVVAHIIGRPGDSWEGTILIDRGSADGVKIDTPVVAAQGLLGQVSVVAVHSAKVRLITDQNSGVAALVQSTRATGVVRGSVDGKLSLDFITVSKPPKVGDVVLTSGLGGTYPKGIVIGDVTRSEEDPSGLYPHIEVRSRVPIGDIEEVLVLVGASTGQTAGGVE